MTAEEKLCRKILSAKRVDEFSETLGELQGYRNEILRSLLEKVKRLENEVNGAIDSQKEEELQVPEWLKGQSHAYGAVTYLIQSELNAEGK